jgi:hypothetical protein
MHRGRVLANLKMDREPVEDTAGAVKMLCSNRMLDTAAMDCSSSSPFLTAW